MKGIYWLIIIAIALTVGFLLINKYYIPSEDEELFNVSISTEYNRKLVKTGLEINGKLINTSTSYEIIQLKEGMVKIKNKNIEDQNYYEDETTFNLTGNARIDLVLDKPDLPEIIVKDGNPITLVLESDNFKEVDFCLIGSYNYLFLEAPEFTEIGKLKNFEHYDACYNGDFSLEGNKQEIEVTYTQFSEITEADYINITLLDKQLNQVTKTIK